MLVVRNETEDDVDAKAFLDYLNEHTETSALAESLGQILDARRASATRRGVRVEAPAAVCIAS